MLTAGKIQASFPRLQPMSTPVASPERIVTGKGIGLARAAAGEGAGRAVEDPARCRVAGISGGRVVAADMIRYVQGRAAGGMGLIVITVMQLAVQPVCDDVTLPLGAMPGIHGYIFISRRSNRRCQPSAPFTES